MALEGLLGGGGSSPLDLYGDLFTPEQKAALREQQITQGLLGMADRFGKLAMPSRAPVPFGAILGQGLAGLGAGDEGVDRQLKAMQVAEQVRHSQQERSVLGEVLPVVRRLTQRLIAGGMPAAQAMQVAQSAVGAGAAPGGGGAAPAAVPGPPAVAPPAPAPPGVAGAFGSAGEYGAGQAATGVLGPPPGMPPPIDPRAAGAEKPGAPPYVPGRQGGLLSLPGPIQLASYDGGGLPGQGIFASLANGGSAPGGPPFSGGGGPDLSDAALASDAGGGGDDRLSDPAYLAKRARDLALAEKYESGGRNIEQGVVGPQGGYNPSVGRVTGPSSASGNWQMIDSTWRNAARDAGIDTQLYPRAITAPREVQQKAAEALYDKRGLADWAPYNRNLARAVGWTGPAGDGGSGGGTRMASGAPNLSDAALASDAGGGGDNAPAGGGVGGLGIDPQGLAALNAMLKLGGVKSDPLGSLLETYYKSPGYLAEKARTEATEQKKVGLEYDPKIAAATAAATQKYIQENETHKSGLDLARDLIGKGVYLDKDTGTMKPITNAAEAFAAIDNAKEKFKSEGEIVTVTLTPPGANRPQEMQMTRAQAKDVVEGRAVPSLGIPAMSGIKIGKPVFSPGEAALAPAEAKDIFDKHQAATDAAMTIETNKEARALLDGGVITGFGADRVTALAKLGNALKLTGKTTQETVANTESYLSTTAGNVGRMIKQFGAGTGLSDADREYAAQMAAGKVTLDETSIRRILDINDRASLNIINRHNQRVSKIAPGATMTDLNVPVPTPYTPPKASTEGPAVAARARAADALAKGADRNIVLKRLQDAGISTEGL